MFFADRRMFLEVFADDITSKISNIINGNIVILTSFALSSSPSSKGVAKGKKLLLKFIWSTLWGGILENVVAIDYISIVQSFIVISCFIWRCSIEEVDQPRNACP